MDLRDLRSASYEGGQAGSAVSKRDETERSTTLIWALPTRLLLVLLLSRRCHRAFSPSAD